MIKNITEATFFVFDDNSAELNYNGIFFCRDFKSTLLNLACLLEIPECTSQASNIFLSWLTNNGPKPYPDLRSLVYNTGKLLQLILGH